MKKSELIKLIHETIHSALQEELNAPSFSFEELRKLKTPENVLAYASQHLKQLGKGSTRTVFELPDGKTVLKVPTATGDEWQNEDEFKAHACAANSPYITKIFKKAPKYTWLIMEKAQPITEAQCDQKFMELTGLPTNEISKAMLVGFSPSKNWSHYSEAVENHKRLFSTNSWYKGFFETFQRCKMHPDEVAAENMGLTEDGRFVFIDFGRTYDLPWWG